MQFLKHAAHATTSSLFAPARCVWRGSETGDETRETATENFASFEGLRIRTHSVPLRGSDEARYGSIATGLEMFCSQRVKDLHTGERISSDTKDRHLTTLANVRKSVERVDGHRESAAAKEILAIVVEAERKINSFQAKAADFREGTSGIRGVAREATRSGLLGAGWVLSHTGNATFDPALANIELPPQRAATDIPFESITFPTLKGDAVVEETRFGLRCMTAKEWAAA